MPTYLPDNLPTKLKSFLRTYLTSYQLYCRPAYPLIPMYLPIYFLQPFLPPFFFTYLPAYLHTYLSTYAASCLPTYISYFLPTYWPSSLYLWCFRTNDIQWLQTEVFSYLKRRTSVPTNLLFYFFFLKNHFLLLSTFSLFSPFILSLLLIGTRGAKIFRVPPLGWQQHRHIYRQNKLFNHNMRN